MSDAKEKVRSDEMTGSEKLAREMADKITGGDIAPQDRPIVRKALDQADAPLVGRARADQALGRATGH